MLLTLDMGNTHITLGVFEGETLRFTARMATELQRTEDQYAADLLSIFSLHGVDCDKVNGAIIGSVVPALTGVLAKAVQETVGVKPLIVGPGVKTGLNIHIDQPAALGADLVCGAVAAAACMKTPCVIADLGTITKLCVLDENGAFIGGAFSAGLGISLDAIAKRTAQLPYVALQAPERVISPQTVGAIQSGTVFGAAAMIDGMLERMETELGQPVSVIATGGHCAQVVAHCKRKDIVVDEHLLLKGLKLIFDRNA